MKIKFSYLVFIPAFLCLIPSCMCTTCIKQNGLSGVIHDSVTGLESRSKCWDIDVPEDTYIRLNFKQHSQVRVNYCSSSHVVITAAQTNESYRFCFSVGESLESITALSNVNVVYLHNGDRLNHYYSSFNLSYHIEDRICTQDNHFRCSSHTCIPDRKRCDGVQDCRNGVDEIGCALDVKGLKESRENAITWLKSQQSSSYGWGKNTHRAITALYLAQAASFLGQNLEEELIAKELELETSLAVLKNSTDPLSVSELSMFVNALTVTCHDPRKFYGFDLLQILAERASIEESPSPRAYLTLCNSNWTLTQSDVRSLLKLLYTNSEYPFVLDVQAVTVMALTCAKYKVKEFSSIEKALDTYNVTVERFVSSQLSDGSFGNVYTTALVTQALIVSKQELNRRWNMTSTIQYLMKQLNSSSVDFLSTYLALPIFSGKSLLDLDTVDCSNSSRKQEKDGISDLINKIGEKKRIQYSLYIGDRKDIIHTIFLRMPVNSSAYDVLRVAEAADSKYKFLHRHVSGRMYVYEIAGITNDPEAGQFWLLYTGDTHINGTVKHHLESPDQFYLGNEENLIMWYKSAHI